MPLLSWKEDEPAVNVVKLPYWESSSRAMGRSRLATWTEQHKGRVGRRSATYPFLPGPRAHETTTTSPLPGLLLSCACNYTATRQQLHTAAMRGVHGACAAGPRTRWHGRRVASPTEEVGQEAEPIDHDQLGRMLRRRQMYTMCINGLL